MEDKRTYDSPIPDPGPYLAKVVNHLDSKFMGSLEVELLKVSASGNTAEGTGEIITVKYMSPFYGVTPFSGLTNNEGYKYTQKSYGMWAIPPDVGTQVLVIFAEGNRSRGYWIGCVQDEYMNFMLPGMASTFYNDTDTTEPHPVGEYNKKLETGAGRNPTKFIKPSSPDAVKVRKEQGLFLDSIRGTTTSSARREVPSMVFGWSTPGPEDRREGAPRTQYGSPGGGGTQRFYNRLGGSTFVMDDGDPSILRTGYAGNSKAFYVSVEEETDEVQGYPDVPHNELVRLRTRTGHQILLHNSEDLIYIGNARGTAWIELTSNGKIDIYSRDSISVRSELDMNFIADRDINFQAGKDINVNAGTNFKQTVGGQTDLKTTGDMNISVGGDNNFLVGGDINITTGKDYNLNITADGKITTGSALDINVAEATKLTTADTLDIKSGTNTRMSQGGTLDINATNAAKITGSTIDLNPESPAATALDSAKAPVAKQAERANFPVRLPEHEPWLGHEHLDPTIFTAQNTRARPEPSPVNRFSSPPVDDIDTDTRPTSSEARDAVNDGKEVVDGKTVEIESNGVVAGQEGKIGEQPRKPASPSDMERYFLHRLITKIGLDHTKSAREGGNAEAVAMTLAQIQHECLFEPKSENTNYSYEGILKTFDKGLIRVCAREFNKPRKEVTRRDKETIAARIARKPATIANTFYGGRYGNGPDEGYKYRGRGLIQLTFKNNYIERGRAAGHPEIVENPDLANDPIIATDLAVAYFNGAKGKNINWSSSSLDTLAAQFEASVGYADKRNQTPKRRKTAGEKLTSLLNGEITPLTSLTLEEDGKNIEADPVETPDTFKQEVKGPR